MCKNCTKNGLAQFSYCSKANSRNNDNICKLKQEKETKKLN